MDSTQNIISLCTGYGGIELGLRRVSPNFRTVAYVEIETFACTNLVAKIEENKLDAAPIWTDLKTFPAEPFCGKVHGIIGGYPCQPWSNAGKRLGTDDPRHLWPYIFEHIRTIRPIWCFFENVGGHLTLGFKEVFASLRDLGYKVEAGLFTAAEVGAPHKRERLFILARLDDTGSRTIWKDVKNIGTTDRKINQTSNTGVLSTGQLDNSMQRRHGDTEKEICSRRNGVVDADVGNPLSQQGRLYTSRRVGETETRSTGEELADTEGQRPLLASRTWTGGAGLANSDRWPARPGQPQYDWEEPRTVKSGMGKSTHGTAKELDPATFRVDRLRLLGNGVVPHTAELAWRTLWHKIC